MRLVSHFALLATLFLTGMPEARGFLAPAPLQQDPEVSDDMFSGTVTSVTRDQVRVARSEESRTFRITPRTKIEGKLTANARVTVGFAVTDMGDVAIRIIVRPPLKEPQPK